jgi:hypothetical protein
MCWTSIPQSLVLWHAQVLILQGVCCRFCCIILPRNSAKLSARSILHLWHIPLFRIYKNKQKKIKIQERSDVVRMLQLKMSRSISDLDRNVFSVWQAWQRNFIDNGKYFQKIKIHHTRLKFAEVWRSIHRFLLFLYFLLQLSLETVSVWRPLSSIPLTFLLICFCFTYFD